MASFPAYFPAVTPAATEQVAHRLLLTSCFGGREPAGHSGHHAGRFELHRHRSGRPVGGDSGRPVGGDPDLPECHVPVTVLARVLESAARRTYAPHSSLGKRLPPWLAAHVRNRCQPGRILR